MNILANLTEISDAALSVALYQNISAFQVSVGNSWFFLGADNLSVEVDQATGHRQTHPQAALWVQAAVLQEIVERPELMIVGDEPQLGAGILGCHVGGYETLKSKQRKCCCLNVFSLRCNFFSLEAKDWCHTEYVVVSQLYSVVDLCLSKPGVLISRGENLDGDTFPHPRSPPNLSIPAFAYERSDTINCK